MAATRQFFGDMKLIRPVSFRLPEPVYRELTKNLNGNKISDVLRDIVQNYTGQQFINSKDHNNEKQSDQ